MARFFCLLLLVPMGIGCQATQPSLLLEGYWEGIASLDGARFFFGLESKDGRITVHIPEMLISDAETDAKALKHGRISISLPVGSAELRLLLHEEGGNLTGKIAYNTKVGTTTLYCGTYRKAFRAETRSPREGEEIIVETPYGTVHGTLLLPQGALPVNAVLLIAGSGPTDRDGNSEQIVENNDMLWHLAQELHKAGIASLRYDKLGVGESSFIDDSNAQNYSFEDSVHVARMLVSSMRADSRIQSIGIIGHSEGSLTGLLAARDAHVDFFISLAGNGDPIASQLVKQVKRINRDAALLLEKRLDQIQRSHYETTGNAIVDSLIPPGSEVYLGSWMKFDPNALLATIAVPTLVVKGDRDERLVAEDDWFTRSGMPDYVRFKVIPQMGHLLKEADSETDITRSYRDRTMRLHPDLIETITTCIANI